MGSPGSGEMLHLGLVVCGLKGGLGARRQPKTGLREQRECKTSLQMVVQVAVAPGNQGPPGEAVPMPVGGRLSGGPLLPHGWSGPARKLF